MNGLELLPLVLLGFLLFYLIFPIWSYMRLSQMLREEREENRRVQTLLLNLLRSLQAKTEQKTSSSESLADAEPEARTAASSDSHAEKKSGAEILRSSEPVSSLIFPDEESCGAEQGAETQEKLSVESSAAGLSGTGLPAGEKNSEKAELPEKKRSTRGQAKRGTELSNGSASARITAIKTSPASMRLPRPG